MNKLSIFFAWALMAASASAAPYLVYSGSIAGTNVTSASATNAATKVYLLTDAADTSNFAILFVTLASGQYTVISRPSDTPASGEANNNFFASTGKEAFLCYSGEVTDSNNNTAVIRGYGSGALTAQPTELAAARTKALVVDLKTKGVANGSFTFSTLSPAVTTGTLALVKSISGTALGYAISSAGELTTATTPGALSLSLNVSLSGLANIGGGYAVTFTTEAAVMPVSVPSGTSESDAFAAWLASFAQAHGYTAASSSAPNSSAAALSFSGSTEIGGGSLAIGGALDSGGASVVQVGVGTLILNSGTSGISTLALTSSLTLSGSNTFPGVLTIGGLVSSANAGTSTGTVTISDPDTTGATLSLNVGSTYTGSVTISSGALGGSGTLTVGGGGGLSLPGSGQTQSLNGSLGLTNATLEITAINTDSTVDGTITDNAGGGGLLQSFSFTEATLTADGQTSGFSIGGTYAGVVGISHGTVTNTSGALSFFGSTITITTGTTTP